ncbi:putative cation transporter [Methylococcus capsulatus str. Bath]|uniref:Putative cation transporter n=1 Tax=Methylococcus capsulatus (strain ATCC 33009 / NCIMB 11132 / Bath) TaxID=243233 RepID=Q60AK2_METCA|nr:cation transporter [Methylococcus capsulatus]AAU93049.1 putative cation transporter [Methylococcus capsulatus str. Bath]
MAAPELLIPWADFLLCVALIAVAGNRLSRYGDVIAEKTGLSGSWIGLILLATATSLPELITGAAAVTAAGAPDIAAGDVLGSCVFNLVILVALDFLHRHESVYRRASQGHLLSAGFGIILLGLVGVNLLLADKHIVPTLGWVGLYSPLLGLLYLFSMRAVFLYEREQMAAFTEDMTEQYPGIRLRRAVMWYVAVAAVVVGAGVWLPSIGTTLAEVMGWNKSFVGTLFVAAATSMPELSVTIGAVRIRAVDMAIANLLGSNLFDLCILAIDDLAYLPGPLLSHVSSVHALSAFSAMVMTGIFIVGLLYRAGTRLFKTVGWVSIALLLVYLGNAYVLYLYDK